MASTVFLKKLNETSTREERINGMRGICAQSILESIISGGDKVAVKIHVGEAEKAKVIEPVVVKEVVSRIKGLGGMPFLTETATLYKGQRSNAVSHLQHAYRHGFTYENTGAPFIMADGLSGNAEIEVEIHGILNKSVSIAREIAFTDAMVIVSHATGHIASALGACLKNVGMGLSSRKGKMRQHSTMNPVVKAEVCTMCGQCLQWCPENAIIEQNGKAFIRKNLCIGCGECLTVCKFDAVSYNWGSGSKDLQQSIAEHALGVVKGKEKKSYYINGLMDMTANCDCMTQTSERVIPDIGFLASTDPVALDQATLDLTEKTFQHGLVHSAWPNLDPSIQLEHGEKIGLGSRKYELKEI